MYKINKSIALNQNKVLASEAYRLVPKNIEYTQKVQEELLSPPTVPDLSVHDLAKVVSAQKEYQIELWDNLTINANTQNLFSALRNAWSSRKDHLNPIAPTPPSGPNPNLPNVPLP